jgi:hypothetical protein
MGLKRSRTRPDLARHTPGGSAQPQRARVRTDLPRFTPGGGLDHAAMARRVLESEDTERVATGRSLTPAPGPCAVPRRRLRVSLPDDLVEALLARGDDEGRSMSSMLSEAATLWLEVTQA